MIPEATPISPPDIGSLGGPGWSPSALASPAHIRAGDGWVTSAHRLWLEWCILAIEDALRDAFGTRATISPLRAAPAAGPGSSPVFGATLELHAPLAAQPSRLSIFVRPDGSRAIADAVMLQAAGLRGFGGPSAAELGVLEFVTLLLTDAINRRLADESGPAAPNLRIIQFTAGPETTAAVKAAPGPVVNLLISIADRQGDAFVAFEGWATGSTELPTTMRPGVEVAQEIEAGVALPAVPVALSELNAAAVGDCVLLGASNLDDRLTGASLVTTTGWQLCPVVFMHDSPTTVGVRCHHLAPRPCPDWMSDDHSPMLIPVLGQTRIPLLTLRSWSLDRIQDFPKSSWSVQLWRNGRPWATGELARAGGELAARIIRINERTEAPR